MTKPLSITITRCILHDVDAQVTDSDCYDEQRIKDFHCERWHYIGVVAEATLEFPCGEDVIETKLYSPGLWDIESDSTEQYLNEVFEEERKVLIEMIKAFRAASSVTVETDKVAGEYKPCSI